MADGARTVAQTDSSSTARPQVTMSLRSAFAIVVAFGGHRADPRDRVGRPACLRVGVDRDRDRRARAAARRVLPAVHVAWARGAARRRAVPRFDRLPRVPHRARGERADEAAAGGRARTSQRSSKPTRICCRRSTSPIGSSGSSTPSRNGCGVAPPPRRFGRPRIAGSRRSPASCSRCSSCCTGRRSSMRPTPRSAIPAPPDACRAHRAGRGRTRVRLRAPEGRDRRRRRPARVRDRPDGRCSRARQRSRCGSRCGR